ncbi:MULTISPECIES: hypothetical protein [Shewanella]|uniref:DNA-binding protein n=1 Tax=Shewanella marisflavi TaxID=260364 RepID=A0ABX5WLB2_9GAMM|nr:MULTISPECIES: hypothetical protein [Shewanella]QDF75269.1 hypothetical protein FGA12_08925 [Shewanella marisflavi]
MDQTLITGRELAERIKFSANYINSTLRDSVFTEGKHYIRPFNGRKILYIWEEVEAELYQSACRNEHFIPMAGGRVCHG